MHKVYRQGAQLYEEFHRAQVPPNGVAIWNLGQSGVFVKGTPTDSGKDAPAFAIDPYLTGSIEVNHPGTEFVRAYLPPIEPEDLAPVSLVLLTHHHDDHMDLTTISRLHKASPNTRFVVPAPHERMLLDQGISADAIILAHANEVVRAADLEILPIAAAHTDYETDANGHHLYLGYVVYVNGVSIYHSGDTIVTDELVQTLQAIRPQIAMLPVNGGDYSRTKRGIVGNMTAREAVDFADAIGVDLLLPNHYDMFPNNRENPAHLVDYLFHHHANIKFHMLAVGERFIYFP
ncbi:MBL fold metallo-hydrolase [Alicyclobacillus acidoterrestris]|uniref:MBL fold metallo-hydrolase n=1 Tax=Alicyclobacillus suci TaxID=2816080 RepID=UPI0011949E3E|nr:MBL fold metallo-hydrolase [Alicyclobacillus suci]GEO28024.1 MBL fold metallo-hydrolase [Alicyclobacillus acidoterrestris]